MGGFSFQDYNGLPKSSIDIIFSGDNIESSLIAACPDVYPGFPNQDPYKFTLYSPNLDTIVFNSAHLIDIPKTILKVTDMLTSKNPKVYKNFMKQIEALKRLEENENVPSEVKINKLENSLSTLKVYLQNSLDSFYFGYNRNSQGGVRLFEPHGHLGYFNFNKKLLTDKKNGVCNPIALNSYELSFINYVKEHMEDFSDLLIYGNKLDKSKSNLVAILNPASYFVNSYIIFPITKGIDSICDIDSALAGENYQLLENTEFALNTVVTENQYDFINSILKQMDLDENGLDFLRKNIDSLKKHKYISSVPDGFTVGGEYSIKSNKKNHFFYQKFFARYDGDFTDKNGKNIGISSMFNKGVIFPHMSNK